MQDDEMQNSLIVDRFLDIGIVDFWFNARLEQFEILRSIGVK